MSHEQRDTVRSTDIRKLQLTVHELSEAVEELSAELDEQTNGNGTPKHAQKARKCAQRACETVPDPRDADRSAPKWEREGYDSKQAWLEAKQE